MQDFVDCLWNVGRVASVKSLIKSTYLYTAAIISICVHYRIIFTVTGN